MIVAVYLTGNHKVDFVAVCETAPHWGMPWPAESTSKQSEYLPKSFLLSIMSPIVVVTGANKGIGYEVSKKLIADGAKVIMTDKDESRLGEAASELKPFGAVKLDTTSDDSIKLAEQEIERLAPLIDVLINNAGVAHHSESFELKK
ncbi:hypothetical protein FOZ61_008475, partial [Perkinsus olseni]